MAPAVTTDKLLELSDSAELIIMGAHKEPKGKCNIAGYEFPLFRYHLPSGNVFSEAVHRVRVGKRLVLSLALKDERGNWVARSLHNVKR